MITILILSVVGAVIAAVIGTFWFSQNSPMGKIHMKFVGFDKLSEDEQKKKIEEYKPKMAKIYSAQLALSFLTSFAVVYIVSLSIQNGVPILLALGFVLFSWLCFTVPAIGSGMLWGTGEKAVALKEFLSNIASNLITVLVIALLTSLFFKPMYSDMGTMPEPIQGKINIEAVCRGVLISMTFTDGEAAEKFVSECKDGKHPEVIEQFKKDLNLGDGATI